MKLTAVILTKNEEKNIERAIKSIQFCDEIIVIDDYSGDKTISKISNLKSQIPNKFKIPNSKQKIKIYRGHLEGDFAGQRNSAMERAKGEWILFVDADEEISEELRKEILKQVQDDKSKSYAYRLKRRDFFWDKELRFGETEKIRNQGIIRLVKKNSGKWYGKVHEEFQTSDKVGQLRSFLDHYPHPSIKDFLNEINFYSTLRAKELFEQRKKTGIFAIVFYPLGKFFLTYFIKLGFRDGPAGFAYAFLMSFHSFLVRAKLYQFTKINKFGRHSGKRSASRIDSGQARMT